MGHLNAHQWARLPDKCEYSAFVTQSACYNKKDKPQQYPITHKSNEHVDHYASAPEYFADDKNSSFIINNSPDTDEGSRDDETSNTLRNINTQPHPHESLWQIFHNYAENKERNCMNFTLLGYVHVQLE